MPAPSSASGWQIALEVHPPGWRFPSGSSWIAGWVWAGAGRAVTDLRAWVDHRPFLGLHGLPRPGLDETLPGPSRPPYAGFSFLLTLHAGAATLRIEARDLDGGWHDLFTTPIHADTTDAPPGPPALAPLLAEALPELLRSRLRNVDTPWSRLAHEVLAERLASPLDSLPNPPFVGALEEPRATGRVRHGRLSVTGWLTHRTASIVRLTAVLDPLREVPVTYGLPRMDLGTEFPDLAGRTHVAFCAQVDLPSGLSKPVQLKLFAELDNGEKHLAFAQRFTPEPPPGFPKPRPAAPAWLRLRATLALIGAARGLRLTTEGVWPAARAALPPPHRPTHTSRAPAGGSAAAPRRVLVATHNLNFEGAPRLVCELMRFFGRQTGARLHLVSPTEGPMRRLFEEAGMTVEVLPLADALGAADPENFHARLHAATATLAVGSFDLVVANTMVSFWAVHLAEHAGVPAVMYVHESAPIERLFAPLIDGALYPVVEDAFRRARRVIFTAEASRQIFERLDTGHFRVLPSWLDVAAIERFAAEHAKAGLRAKHGLPDDAVVVLNLGTVCERKGQHVFVQAVRLLEAEWAARPPPSPVDFLLVGAREDDFLKEIRAQIAAAGLQRVRIVRETRENFDFHRLADVLVCTSFEESSPRVLLEAASFGTPIVSTDVNGIPEIVTGREAWLVEAGDPYHLAAALRQALAAHREGDRSRAERARRTVTARFDERVSLPRHVKAILEALNP
jgi:glycosyltransferase involved in cell wall biosynthesis